MASKSTAISAKTAKKTTNTGKHNIVVDSINDHNAYANNAEDYFKKTPAGTKTPADKPSKKLKKAP